jgi:hypothetical protein
VFIARGSAKVSAVEEKAFITLIYTIFAEKKRGFTITIFAEEKRSFSIGKRCNFLAYTHNIEKLKHLTKKLKIYFLF